MEFEKYYTELISYGDALLRQKNLNNISGEDLVSEAFINFKESKKEFSIGLIRSLIKRAFYKEMAYRQSIFNGSDNNYLPRNKTCLVCKEDIPIGAFYIWHETSTGRYRSHSYCKNCGNKKSKEWFLDNIEHCRNRSLSYYYKNREKILLQRSTPEYKNKKAEWDKSEKAKAQKKQYYLKNRQMLISYQIKYNKIKRRHKAA